MCRMGTQSLSGSLDTGRFVYPGGWCRGAEVFAVSGCTSKCLQEHLHWLHESISEPESKEHEKIP